MSASAGRQAAKVDQQRATHGASALLNCPSAAHIFESTLPPDQTCFFYASQCPEPVNGVFVNDIVEDNDDYFEATVKKLHSKILDVLESHFEEQASQEASQQESNAAPAGEEATAIEASNMPTLLART